MSAVVSPLTRREVLFYFFLGALLFLALLITGIVFWVVTPPRNIERVGVLADFPPSERPYTVTAGDRKLWLVNLNGELLVFNPLLVTFQGRMRCNVSWVPTNHRFEDPCSGVKLGLDGLWLDPSAAYQPSDEPHHLERYRVEVREGEIWIDLTAATPLPN